jgi:hypothetical protein
VYTEEETIELNKFMFKESNYKRAAYLKNGLHFNENAEEKLQKFADRYELEVIRVGGGNQKIFWDSYEKLKSMI